MPCSSNRCSRSARMLEEMASSELVNSSRKCRRLPNIMSRMTSRLHLSPTTSSVRLIGQPERGSSVIGGVQTCGQNAAEKPLAILHQLSQATTSCKIQVVEGKPDGKTGDVEHDDARRFCRRSKPRHFLASRC